MPRIFITASNLDKKTITDWQRERQLAIKRQMAISYPVTTLADSTKDFDITRTLVAHATITSVSAPGSAKAGASVGISVTVKNDGDTAVPIWCQIVDRDTGSVVGAQQQSAQIPVGSSTTFSWTLTMPSKNWNLQAQAAGGLANPVQTTKDFTITLETVFANITGISAPSSAKAGDAVNIVVTVQNTGNATGTLYCRIVDRDDGSVPGAQKSVSVAPGGSGLFGWDLTMPSKDWHLRAEAWH